MNRDMALTLDGLLTSVRGSLDMAALHMKNNLSEQESRKYIRHIGNSMAELFEISQDLYNQFPDIIPKELR